MKPLAAAWVLLVAARGPAQVASPTTRADSSTAPADRTPEIAQMLDGKVDIEIHDKTILAAFREIEKKTGLPLKIDEATLDRLPYGDQTKLNATIRGLTLREALTELLRPAGLTLQVRSTEVGVIAVAPLRRLVRRATWEELDMLRRLSEAPWSAEQWNKLDVQFLDSGPDGKMTKETLGRLAQAVGAGTASEVLTAACNQQGLTWYPSGDKIVVISKRRQMERQLSKRISRKYYGVPLSEVLLDLGRDADVLVKIEPGAIASLPAQVAQAFSLTVENSSIRQAYEVIAGTTGLGFSIDQEGVRFSASHLVPEAVTAGSDASLSAAVEAMRASSVVAMVTKKGENGEPDVTFFVRDSDLPSDLRELRKKKVEDIVDAVRKALGAEKDVGVE